MFKEYLPEDNYPQNKTASLIAALVFIALAMNDTVKFFLSWFTR